MRANTTRHFRPTAARAGRPGYVSLLAVFTISIFMLSLMVFAYQRAINAQGIQADIQTQADYREKEETILRSIVAITPNRAIRAMQSGSNATTAASNPLRFQNIFTEALVQSNARTSISTAVLNQLNIPDNFKGNSGDSGLANIGRMFKSVSTNTGNVTGGLERDLGAGFPVALNTNGTVANDDIYPLITSRKVYGSYASGKVGLSTTTYKDFNLLPYPQINFGYATPGELFVAKRNWWAFSMDLADQDDNITKLARFKRRFVLSIYEIPSQLPISASSFMALGAHADGSAWENVTISGNIFAGKAEVVGNTALPNLATRRGANLSSEATIGGKTFSGNPFAPGVRETYRLTEGEFFPISLASESGKAAFVSINRGAEYFDRFAHAAETNTVSPTGWNEYSVGALQCAMQLDITRANPNRDPQTLRFRFFANNVRREIFKTGTGEWAETGLPPVGYVDVADENSSVTFTTPHDLAYGKVGAFAYRYNFTGTVTFDNATFGDPLVGTRKRGFARPTTYVPSQITPFEFKDLPNQKKCIAVYPERIKNFLTIVGGSGPDVNRSLAVNVDYTLGSTANLVKPSIPSTANDYGVILQECRNFTTFTKGFSLVTNLRLYIGDDFNIVPTTPPPGYTPPSGVFYPPCSLFAPEKRYGVNFDPFAVEVSGQIGSVASENAANPVRPLDAFGVSGTSVNSNRIKMNLSTIRHPAELPPIFMMNWLILLEEKRAEFD